MADKKADSTQERSVKEIEADLAANRDRLARTVDELAVRVSPQEIKRRQTEKVKAKVEEVKLRADETMHDQDGGLRLDLVSAGLGVVSVVTVVLGLARRTFYRG